MRGPAATQAESMSATGRLCRLDNSNWTPVTLIPKNMNHFLRIASYHSLRIKFAREIGAKHKV